MGPYPRVIRPKEGDARLRLSIPMGKTRWRVLLKATAPFPPSGGAALWGHVKLGPGLGEAKPLGNGPISLCPLCDTVMK